MLAMTDKLDTVDQGRWHNCALKALGILEAETAKHGNADVATLAERAAQLADDMLAYEMRARKRCPCHDVMQAGRYI
jgi:hypothetical protein